MSTKIEDLRIIEKPLSEPITITEEKYRIGINKEIKKELEDIITNIKQSRYIFSAGTQQLACSNFGNFHFYFSFHKWNWKLLFSF